MGWGAGASCTPRPPIRPPPAEARVVAVLFLGLLLDLLAFTLLLPLLPGLLESHGRARDPLYGAWQRGVDWFAAAIGMPAEQRYNSVLFGGLIGSIFSVLQFLSAPLTGAISDCLGRRPVMVLSLVRVPTEGEHAAVPHPAGLWGGRGQLWAPGGPSSPLGLVLEGAVVPVSEPGCPRAVLATRGTGKQGAVPLAVPEQGRVPGVALGLPAPFRPLLVSSDCACPLALALRQAGLAASYAVWAASDSFAAFLASRVIGGISKGNVSLSTAIVADLGSPPARSRGMAVIGVAFSLGFTLGPMLGASLPVRTAPWLALLFAVSDLLFLFCFLPETLPPEKRAPSISLGFRAAADLLSPLALLRFSAVARGQDPPTGARLGHLRRLGLVYFLYLFLFSGLEFTLSFLAHQRFQFSSLQQGKMFFFIGVTMATIQGTYTRRISPGREIVAVKRAILLLVPAFLLIGWGLTLPTLGLGLLLYSFAAAVVVPCLSSVVAGYGSPGQKGTVMGTLRSLGALARALGPMVAASAYWLAGAPACFTASAGLFLLPFLLLRGPVAPAPTPKAE